MSASPQLHKYVIVCERWVTELSLDPSNPYCFSVPSPALYPSSMMKGDKLGKESQRDLSLRIWAEKGTPSVWQSVPAEYDEFFNQPIIFKSFSSWDSWLQGCALQSTGKRVNQGVGRGRFIIQSYVVAPVGLCTWSDLGGKMWLSEVTRKSGNALPLLTPVHILQNLFISSPCFCKWTLQKGAVPRAGRCTVSTVHPTLLSVPWWNKLVCHSVTAWSSLCLGFWFLLPMGSTLHFSWYSIASCWFLQFAKSVCSLSKLGVTCEFYNIPSISLCKPLIKILKRAESKPVLLALCFQFRYTTDNNWESRFSVGSTPAFLWFI